MSAPQQVGEDIPLDATRVARLYAAKTGLAVALVDVVTAQEIGRLPLRDRSEAALDEVVAALASLRSELEAPRARDNVPHVGALAGIEVRPVEVHVSVRSGLPAFSFTGMMDGSVREARTRVRAALEQSGYPFPHRLVEVSLAPLDMPKSGSAFDLAIAIGVLVATGSMPAVALGDWILLAELSLSGGLRGVRGALPQCLAARERGFRGVIMADDNAAEGAAVPGLDVRCARNLADVVAFLSGGEGLPAASVVASRGRRPAVEPVRVPLEAAPGYAVPKHALAIAAAGGHNMLMIGPPGTGKTLLSRMLPGLMPALSPEEALQVGSIYSAAGMGLFVDRAYRGPHHTASATGLVGGGDPVRPGEFELAHGGVLFMDELPEFPRESMEALREPMEDGKVTIVRARSRVVFPARFVLVGAMAPCPCGWHGDPSDRCDCSAERVKRYQARVTGPLLDHVDLFVRVTPASNRAEFHVSTEQVRKSVEVAREMQRASGGTLNGRASRSASQGFVDAGSTAAKFLAAEAARLGLDARGVTRARRVARTVANLAGRNAVRAVDVEEALLYAAPVAGLVG